MDYQFFDDIIRKMEKENHILELMNRIEPLTVEMNIAILKIIDEDWKQYTEMAGIKIAAMFLSDLSDEKLDRLYAFLIKYFRSKDIKRYHT